ncbi:YciI family protein [Cryobacterium sp.]|jgi:hypothetical protein|uniref:YciI family protein n=1 Tax=Cryobacterium sp. TaxID=1926290 RepID=UPI002622C909|nr:YciI family protein [Cryobacterium sp.]MCU1445259.1 hypothetical protein [Cryobacterium sp.]
MRFSLLIIRAETREGDISEEELPPFRELFDAYAASLQESGALVAADIYRPAAESTTVTLRDGSHEVREGPFIDAVESLAGCFVIDVANRAAALDWAEKCPAALYGVVEVRPSAVAFQDGRWRGGS